MTSTTITRHRLPALAVAAMFAAVSGIACSGSPIASAPFAPSAVPGVTLAVENGDDSATFGALDKGKEKGKDAKGKEGTTTTTGSAVEAEGAVATATETCPAKTFTIGTQSFTTSATTTYKDGACADLVALAEVEVRAVRQADGKLIATRVEFEGRDAGGKDDADDDEDSEDDDEDSDDDRGNPHHGAGPHDGTVSSLRGTCPAVTFNLRGLRVSTTRATKYVSEAGEVTCAVLRPSVQVLVIGAPGTTSRTFVANTITIVRTPVTPR